MQLPLVDRDRHLGRLDDAISDALDGRGTSVCIEGAAGLGKTALLRAALSAAAACELTVASSACSADGSAPLEPWLDIFNQLGLVHAVSWPFAPGLLGFIEAERLLGDTARDTPLFLGLDDLQNGDEGTLLFTRHLTGKLAASRIVLVATSRPRSQMAPSLHGQVLRLFTPLGLAPLGAAAVERLCVARGFSSVSAGFITSLTATTGGVPLHVILALESSDLNATDYRLPSGLTALVTARMGEMQPDEALVVAKAATVGKRVSLDCVAHCGQVAESEAAAAVRAAQAFNIANAGSATQLDLRHELIREAVLGWLDPQQRADAENAAAAWYSREPEGLIRAAHHAIAAAKGDAHYAANAIQLGRVAARSLAAHGAPEDGVSLLDHLLAINESAKVTSQADLLVEHANAVLVAGRLGAAMRHYNSALDAALLKGDPALVSEAAAGLGALWVNTIRTPAAQARVLAIQRRALANLPPEPTSLRLRLRARVAAESMFWEAASPEALMEVVDDALLYGDSATILEVLSVAHNPLLGPQHTEYRLMMADEMTARAADLKTGVLPLMAVCWTAVDLLLAGDPRAAHSFAELRAAAEATQSLSVLYVVRAIETMLLTCRGEFAAAEAMAHEAFTLGGTAEDPDALSYFSGQLVTIRWYQGRDEELLGIIQSSVGSANVDLVDSSFDAGAAALAARAGDTDLATHYLHKVTGFGGLSARPRFSTWLMTMALTIDAAGLLDHVAVVEEAYGLLKPYAHLPIMGSLAVVTLGSAEHWLGIAALYLDQPELAEEHLRAAITAEVAQGNIAAATASRVALADCLDRLPQSQTRTHEVNELLARCRESAASLGMKSLLQHVTSIAARRQTVVMFRQDAGWSLQLGTEVIQVRDLVGMGFLETLTSTPDHWIAATELAFKASVAPQPSQPILDAEGRRALRSRMTQLAASVSEAREAGDLRAQEAAENEMDELAGYLRQTEGINRHSRQFADADERARTSVRKAIVRAIHETRIASTTIADHLEERVITGTACCYLAKRYHGQGLRR